MSEIGKKSENTECVKEREKICEVVEKTVFKENPDQFSKKRADDIVQRRIEKRVENLQGKMSNEKFYSFGWKRLEEKKDLTIDLKEVNPHYSEGKQWKINCQRCVPAYEMRKRGYDVTVLPKPLDPGITDLSYKPFDVWVKPKIINCAENGKADIEKHMSEWGEGSRAQIVITWKGTNSGHTFVAENKNGSVRYYDPQTGCEDASFYFHNVQPGKTQICRIDNLDVTAKIEECCRGV